MARNTHPSLNELLVVLERYEQPLDLASLAQICAQQSMIGHLAVCTQPYLKKIISGEKTIESRFSRSRSVPFEKVQKGDILFLKETAGPLSAIAIAASVRCFGPLKPGEAEYIMDMYQTGLQLEQDFRAMKQKSLYATLITLSNVLSTKLIRVKKVDRRPWVVLKEYREKDTIYGIFDEIPENAIYGQ